MIVDDDTDDADFFCEAIAELFPSAECIRYLNGEEALNQLCEKNFRLPDFIFLDLNMPRMVGKTCLRKLKEDKALRDIPVIIYTTSSSIAHKDEIASLGAAHFLTKPASYKKLCSEIIKAVDLIDTT
jgi:CheY-like chemotaxis protein